MPGKGKMSVTGNLRDVMKESIQAANAYVRSRSVDFGIPASMFEKKDIHVHVPEGATPKDGPSAGVAMVTAIVSVLTGIPVRKDVAMTGEITLRGRVLPIGGLKEKLLAALRAGIKKVLIPEENVKDLADIADEVKNALEIIPVSRADDVLKNALVRMPDAIAWEVEPPPARRRLTPRTPARRRPLSSTELKSLNDVHTCDTTPDGNPPSGVFRTCGIKHPLNPAIFPYLRAFCRVFRLTHGQLTRLFVPALLHLQQITRASAVSLTDASPPAIPDPLCSSERSHPQFNQQKDTLP